MSENMRFYEAFRAVPDEAKKPIAAGRLKGFTDVSPMWRIKTLTERFGPCGIGWVANPVKMHTVENSKSGEIAAFVDIELRFKEGDTWSDPVFGTGGAMLVSLEKGGLHTDDEAFKKAYTDAISVACKSLGVAADVYWDRDTDKYGGYGVRSERALELIQELFSRGKSENEVNAVAVAARGKFVKDLTDDELEMMAKTWRAKAE